MVFNKSFVYPNKMEYLLFNSKHVTILNSNINIDFNIITPSDMAKNFGVISLSDKSMDKHICTIV